MPHLCDPSVKMISGYLDVSETKHLFFWFFESRDKPKEDPLLLWSVGGRGSFGRLVFHVRSADTVASPPPLTRQVERRTRLFLYHRTPLRARSLHDHLHLP
jgi:hypothetical protein